MAKKDPSLKWSDTPRYKKLKKWEKTVKKNDPEFLRDFWRNNPGVKATQANLDAWSKSIGGWIPESKIGYSTPEAMQDMFEDEWEQARLEEQYPGEAKSKRRAAARNVPSRGMSISQLDARGMAHQPGWHPDFPKDPRFNQGKGSLDRQLLKKGGSLRLPRISKAMLPMMLLALLAGGMGMGGNEDLDGLLG
tara:strand:+ start:586 stop:1161 length:576 start_codon:yes stop_codon:yes gene_type:complete